VTLAANLDEFHPWVALANVAAHGCIHYRSGWEAKNPSIKNISVSVRSSSQWAREPLRVSGRGICGVSISHLIRKQLKKRVGAMKRANQ
jgi:hypothetical protein